MKKRYGIVFCLIMIIGFGLINANDIFAKQTSVSNTQQLQQAINENDDVLITDDFTVTNTIVIPSAYSGTIKSGSKNTLTAADNVADMFSVDGANVTFENLKVNMNGKGRFLHIVNNKTVNVNGVDVENSTSESSTKNAEGGAIFVQGGTLNVTDSSFNKGVANKNANAPADSLPHGGAIYGYSVKMNITNSSFSSNKSYASGGAIYIDGNNTSVLTIDGTKEKSVFTANSLSKFDTISQGGAVYVGPGVESTISNTTFKVGFTFNTGGAIRYLGAKNAKVNDCDFIIPEFKEGGNSYGTSGGAIAVEGTNLTIERSKFDASKSNKKVEFSGGFIMLVGNNDFTLRDSSFIGRGYEHNSKTLATYGGAICFEGLNDRENYSTGNALIERTTFTDVAADMNGGAISLGTKKGNQAIGVKLTLKDSSITRARTFLYGTGGGFMYVGKGASATITNTKMNTAVTNNGGGIYNEEGNVLLNGGTTLTSAWAVQFGGGVYNNGNLTVDDATLQSNITGNATWDLGSYAAKNNSEYTGMNIYAAKPVTITPNAKLEANKDVRVLDGKSWINLTGNLKNNIYVSISEKSLGANALESMERYVGYVVAKGQGYTLTKDDAQKLHYFSKKKEAAPYNQKVADIGTHEAVGEWDTVLNPVSKYAVIGQRAEMNFDANGGQYKNGNATMKDIYTIYGPNEGDSSRLSDDKPALQLSEKPARTNWEYLDYYNNRLSDLNRSALSNTDVTADKFDFAKDFHRRLANGGAPIKDILPENVRSLTAYARWVEPAPEPDPINVEIKAKKTLSGREFKDGDSFKFILTAVGDAPMPTGEGNKLTVSNGTVKNFGAIEFTKAGTFKYLVSEEKGTLPGVVYAKEAVSVEVVVEDDGNGKLTATVKYPNSAAEVNITNTYEAEPVTLNGNNLIKVKKILTGRDFKQGDSFSFLLEAKENAPMPTGTGNKVTVTGSDVASFGEIKYTKAGTYKYSLKEEAGNIAGVTYSKESVDVTVNVVDDKNGKLVATVTYGNGKNQAEFTNTYEAGAVTVTGNTAIKVKKTLSGREFKTGDRFTFILTAVGDSPMPTGTGNKVTVTNSTATSFGDIKYTKAGTYKYLVSEEKGTLPGVTYAKDSISVEVVVEDDGNGKLTATVKYPNNGSEANVTNTYGTEPVTLSGNSLIKVKKILTGRAFKQGDSFSFLLEGKENAPMPTGTGNKVTVTGGDVANFGAISYSKAGTYKYTVKEEAGSIAGVTYSKESVDVTVSVADDNNGKLVATVTYGNGKSQAEFTNVYESGAVTITGNTAIKVKKTLNGRDFEAGDSFSFALKAVGEAPMPTGTGNKVTVTDGTAKNFGDIKYTKAGTYVYNVTEERGTLEGITYAKDAVKVEVVVEDDGNGQLTATVKYPDNASEVNIVNTYTAKTGNVYVKYVDTEGNMLEDMSTVANNAKVGTAYSTTQKSFTGYKFLNNPDDSAPVKGTVKEGDQTVIYVYEKEEVAVVKGSVDVIYKDVDGNILAGPDVVVKDAEVGTDYTTEQREFDGYKFSNNPSESAPTRGKVKEGHQSVIYIYEKISKPIIPDEPKPPVVDKPDEPNKPVDGTPDKPNEPVTVTPPEKAVNTGDESTSYYFIFTVLSLIATVAIGERRTKK